MRLRNYKEMVTKEEAEQTFNQLVASATATTVTKKAVETTPRNYRTAVIVAIVVLALMGGGAWWYLKKKGGKAVAGNYTLTPLPKGVTSAGARVR